MELSSRAGALAGAALVCLALVSLLGGGRAQARSPVGARAAAQRPTVRLANTMVGTVLVNHARYTVFMFTRERHGRDVCAKIKHCLRDWPAVTTSGKPVAGRGVKRSLLGTIPFRGRLRQVTYAGHPLHTYRFDYGKASMMAIGNKQFGGSWFALQANGKVVR